MILYLKLVILARHKCHLLIVMRNSFLQLEILSKKFVKGVWTVILDETVFTELVINIALSIIVFNGFAFFNVFASEICSTINKVIVFFIMVEEVLNGYHCRLIFIH